MTVRTLLAALLALALAATTARAHDFWLQPDDATPAAGSLVGHHLRIGHAGSAEVYGRRPDHIVRFEAVDADGVARPLPGAPGADPAARQRVPAAGTVLVAYRSARSQVDMEPAAFEAYLSDEGLDRVRALRAERGETDARGRELYSRCAKALLAVDGAVAPGFDRVLGLDAELVPLRHPLDLARDAEGRLLLPVRLLVGGAPQAGVRVHATALDFAVDESADGLRGRTDARGEVTLALPADAGERFVVLAVHGDAREALPPSVADVPRLEGVPADAPWESLWASLSLPVGPREGGAADGEGDTTDEGGARAEREDR